MVTDKRVSGNKLANILKNISRQNFEFNQDEYDHVYKKLANAAESAAWRGEYEINIKLDNGKNSDLIKNYMPRFRADTGLDVTITDKRIRISWE